MYGRRSFYTAGRARCEHTQHTWRRTRAAQTAIVMPGSRTGRMSQMPALSPAAKLPQHAHAHTQQGRNALTKHERVLGPCYACWAARGRPAPSARQQVGAMQGAQPPACSPRGGRHAADNARMVVGACLLPHALALPSMQGHACCRSQGRGSSQRANEGRAAAMQHVERVRCVQAPRSACKDHAPCRHASAAVCCGRLIGIARMHAHNGRRPRKHGRRMLRTAG